jgi:signal transduction histidine kinase
MPAHSAERELATGVATLAHDLKNPLSIIRARAQLMQRRIDETAALDRQHIQEAFQQIEGATARMAVLLDELVGVSTPTASSAHTEPDGTDLVRTACTMAADFQQTTDRHHIRVQAPARELHGPWQPVHIERILSNLLSNAIKFSPEGGEIVVAVWDEVDPPVNGAWACVRVTDEGIGVPADDLGHVFELRHRGSNARNRVAGTGFGLATVRDLVAEYDGSVSVESEEGRGSCLTVRIPLASSARGVASMFATHA